MEDAAADTVSPDLLEMCEGGGDVTFYCWIKKKKKTTMQHLLS